MDTMSSDQLNQIGYLEEPSNSKVIKLFVIRI